MLLVKAGAVKPELPDYNDMRRYQVLEINLNDGTTVKRLVKTGTNLKIVGKEDLFEEVVEKPPILEVPHDFEDRANNDYEHDFEKTKEAEKILSEDRCCFCNYECPAPTPQENGERFLGILQQCWDHIEESHPLAYEWLS